MTVSSAVDRIAVIAMSRGDDPTDLDLIVEEISATQKKQEEEESEPGPEEALTRNTADEIADRREQTWALRQRGLTYREIMVITDVSIATVKRDLDIYRRNQREKIEYYDREDYISVTVSQYDDILREAWRVCDGADKEVKLKALTTIRQILDSKRKALQDTGVVRKENQVQEIVQIGLVANFTELDVGKAAAALLASQLNLHMGQPTLDVESTAEVEQYDDAELEDDEEAGEE